jgi:hypothetical protein
MQEQRSMSQAGPKIGKEDEFEGLYTEKFRALLRHHGEFVRYERDRAALDIGVHLTDPSASGRRVSQTRIWFQLKGVHKETLPIKRFASDPNIEVRVSLDHLRFWFASPEPIYLAVYIEAADTFLVDDVRDLVYLQWGENFLAPGMFPQDQRQVVIRISTSAVMTADKLMRMRAHQSMRIDRPFFRGRPLGHRLDPLRCLLEMPEPATYVAIVKRLLEVHDYRPAETLDPAALFGERYVEAEQVLLTTGRLHNTFEWVPHMYTQFGWGSADDFRIEGAPQFAQGPVAVLIQGAPHSPPDTDSLRTFAAAMNQQGVDRLLVFGNTDEFGYFGSFFGGLRGTGLTCVPQLLADLAFSLLTATVVYLEFRESITWRTKSYLYSSSTDDRSDEATRGS